PALGIDHPELGPFLDLRSYLFERDVAAFLGVVESPVAVLLDGHSTAFAAGIEPNASKTFGARWRALAALVQFAWSTKHLSDLVQVHLFVVDHLARVLLQPQVLSLHKLEQSAIDVHSLQLMLDGLLENFVDVVSVGFEELSDFERRVPTEGGDILASLSGVAHRLVGLLPHPGDYRDAGMAEDHQR